MQDQLLADCHAFVGVANSVDEIQFKQQLGGKWSMAEVMQHLYLSARPVVRLMTGSRDVFDQWGQVDRALLSYESIATAYQTVLTLGAKAPEPMLPRPEDIDVSKQQMLDRFSAIYEALAEASEGWSVHDLDTLQIPHPVLGKLTVREMLYFTSIHTRHHFRLLVH